MEIAIICLVVVLATLIVGYFFLYRKYIKPLTKQYDKLTQMQTKMLRLFSDFEDMIDGFEEYVEEVKQNIESMQQEFNDDRALLKDYVGDVSVKHEQTAGHALNVENMAAAVQKNAEAIRKQVSFVEQLAQEMQDEHGKLDRIREPVQIRANLDNVAQLRPKQYASARQEQVTNLFKEGLPAAQIARMTGFSKGEVELILEMVLQES